jgi:hypothetical protein
MFNMASTSKPGFEKHKPRPTWKKLDITNQVDAATNDPCTKIAQLGILAPTLYAVMDSQSTTLQQSLSKQLDPSPKNWKVPSTRR